LDRARSCRARARSGAGHGHEVEVEAADRDLLAVAQLVHVDPLAADEHAVQAAVVEDAGVAVLDVDQRVAARDGRVVEADLGRQAAADSRHPAAQLDDAQAATVVVGEVVAVVLERAARLGEPARVLDVVRADRLADRQVAEDRRALELGAAAVGAGRNLVALVQCDREAALLTAEAAGARERASVERVGRVPSEHRADNNVRKKDETI
jgi:hypothetical protein